MTSNSYSVFLGRTGRTSLFLLGLLTAGCAGGAAQVDEGKPVRGLVTLKGKPLTGLTMTLQDGEQGRGASCLLGDGGRFESQSPLPPGKYRVAFGPVLIPFQPESADNSPPAAPSPVPPKLPSDLPRKYQQIGTSDLFVEVQGDGKELDIKIPG